MKRRNFIYIAAVGGAGYFIGSNIVKRRSINNIDETLYIKATLSQMFENSGSFPSLSALNSMYYFEIMRHDPRVRMSKKTFLNDGARWLNESSYEMFDQDFLTLNSEQKERLLKDVSEYKWGDNWLYSLQTFYFESMFCDPLYGANTNKVGWNYLQFEPGFPRPSKVST